MYELVYFIDIRMNILYIGMLNKSIARCLTRQKMFQGEMHDLIGLLDMRFMVITRARV